MRLIDADVLARKWQDVLDSKADEKNSVAYVTFELFIERLAHEPIVDAVPVVRCKDCKHYTTGMAVGICKRDSDNPILPIPYNHFCSYGEREENGE